MNPGSTSTPQLRPLPIRVRLYPRETTASFILRLERRNHLPSGILKGLLPRAGEPWGESLGVLTCHDPGTLMLAMPQLGAYRTTASPLHKLPAGPLPRITGFACNHCALSRTGDSRIEIYRTHEQVLCPIHRRWTGHGTDSPDGQPGLGRCPEITAANRHHRNLISRHGRPCVRTAFHISSHINYRWFEQYRHFGPFTDRYRALISGTRSSCILEPAALWAALYPPTIELAALIASARWAEIAHSQHPGPFLDRVGESITDGWHPRGYQDPLQHWMQEDWRPGFTGQDTLT
ncbi:hypothetical protein [Pseudarthrobacter sp. S9]|uniref:hypothetical protein n=1 Tax=Pseudarthrobacter sp. S9 TaxID=3418421 RepID=UPI003D058ED0